VFSNEFKIRTGIISSVDQVTSMPSDLENALKLLDLQWDPVVYPLELDYDYWSAGTCLISFQMRTSFTPDSYQLEKVVNSLIYCRGSSKSMLAK
jgi:hypothetical protein